MPAEKDQRIDGLKGMRVLCRVVGVSFTEEQKKLIASLVKARKAAEAQGVAMVELNEQLGLSEGERKI